MSSLSITFKIEGQVNGKDVEDKMIPVDAIGDREPKELKLQQVRNQINSKIAIPQGWKFLNSKGAVVLEENNTPLSGILSLDKNGKEGEIRIRANVVAYSGGPADYKLTFTFQGEAPITRVIKLSVAPEEATLNKIRELVDSEGKSLREDKVKWTFNYSDGSKVIDENNTHLANISEPEEKTRGGITTFIAKIKVATEKQSGQWNGKDIIKDPKLIAALKSGEAQEIPVSFPTLPDAVKMTGVDDFKVWHQLDVEKKFTVAKNVARLYNGFNYPDLEVVLSKVQEHGTISAQSVGLPQLQRFIISSEDKWILGQAKTNVNGASAQDKPYAETSSGYSRLAVEKQRNLAVTTAVKVKVPNYGSVDAEYSRAEANASYHQEEKLFLFHETWVPKAELTLPLNTDGNTDKGMAQYNLMTNYAFAHAFDLANTPEDLYLILENWGALIATKVTVGGAYFIANVQEMTVDFTEEQITNAWKIKAQATISGVDVGVGNQGELSESQSKQLNEQYQNKITKAIGGVEELALNKQYGEWLSTLSKVDKWKPLNREGILPIYVVLDPYRKRRFAEILAEGGAAKWQKNDICKSLKYTNFNWYVSFGQQEIDDLLE